MIYLASPYSHPNWLIRESRFLAARQAVGRLLASGHTIFSPIVYSHQFAETHGTEFTAWINFDFRMIDAASELWVLKIDGWDRSIGVIKEIEYARKERMIPVKFVDPETLKVSE